MTIYKPNNPDRKQEKKPMSVPDVVIDDKLPLTGKTSQNGGVAVLLVQRRVSSRNVALCRMMRCIVMLMVLLIVTLLVFSAGVIIFRHVQRKPVFFECRVLYEVDAVVDPGNAAAQVGGSLEGGTAIKSGWFNEKVEVDQANEAYEKMDVPAILDFRRSTVVHDFEMNLTGIVDHDHGRCYILPLNRSAVTQPKNLLDLLEKFKSGYYIPNATVVRETYRVRLPAVEDVESFGPYISMECQFFETYLLTKEQQTIESHDLVQPINLHRKTRSLACSMAGNGFCLGNTFTNKLHCFTVTDCIQ